MYPDASLHALSRGGLTTREVSEEMLGLFAGHVKFINNVVLPGQETPKDLTERVDLDRFLECVEPRVMDKVYVAIQNLSVLDEGAVGN